MTSKVPSEGEFSYIDIDAVDNETNQITRAKRIASSQAPSRASRGLQTGDVLFSLVRPYLKNVALVEKQYADAIASTGFYVCRPFRFIDSEHLRYMMLSPHVINTLMIYMKGENSPSIRSSDLEELMISIPPFDEQKRIVSKLNDLLPMVDYYGRQHHQLIALNKQFPDILRKSIIQEAIQGKLVPQDDEDEPACVLLDRIAEERAKLGKKTAKPIPRIVRRGSETNPTYHEIFADGSEKEITDELPFAIPKSWAWSRLGSVATSNIGLTYKPSDIGPVGVPVYRSNNIQGAHIDLNNLVRVNCKILDNQFLQKGDLLICARNGSRNLVGKNAKIEELSEPTAFGAFMAVCRSEHNSWIRVLLNSIYFDEYLDDSNTTTINQITQKMLLNFIIPIPPHREQKRIISKIERVLHLVETCRQ